jgi:hypothetical protein
MKMRHSNRAIPAEGCGSERANRFVQVETVTNVPGLTGFITSQKKRQNTAALQNASELAFRMTATFWSAAVFCRF